MYLHSIEKNIEIHSRGNCIYSGGKVIVNLPGPMLKIAWFSPLQRLFREKIHQVFFAGDKLIILTKGLIRVYNLQGECLAEFIIERGSRPLRHGIVYVENTIIYGDYWANTKREPVNLYRIDLVSFEQKVLSVFEHVRHIHCTQIDIRDNRYVFVCTGDTDSESGIYRVELSSGIYETVAEGAQCYRAVSLIQDGNILIWGSDSPATQNAIYCLDLVCGGGAKLVVTIDGPAYYSTKSADGSFYIATTIEDRRRHKAIIYASTDRGLSWSPCRLFKKDIWPDKWFGYGSVEFPRGHEYVYGLRYNLCGLREIR